MRIGASVIGMSPTLPRRCRRTAPSCQYEHESCGDERIERLAIVSAEKLISDFSSRRVASELVAFGDATEIGRQIAERALSNEVITPGVTTLAEVAWWIQEQQLQRGLGSSFEVPSIYVTGPNGIEATSNDRIIQRGDILMIDFGVGYLNMWTDQKRIAYVRKPGETALSASIKHAFDQAVKVRDDAVVAARGVEWLSPINHRIQLIR